MQNTYFYGLTRKNPVFKRSVFVYVSIKNRILTQSGHKSRVCVNQPDRLIQPQGIPSNISIPSLPPRQRPARGLLHHTPQPPDREPWETVARQSVCAGSRLQSARRLGRAAGGGAGAQAVLQAKGARAGQYLLPRSRSSVCQAGHAAPPQAYWWHCSWQGQRGVPYGQCQAPCAGPRCSATGLCGGRFPADCPAYRAAVPAAHKASAISKTERLFMGHGPLLRSELWL